MGSKTSEMIDFFLQKEDFREEEDNFKSSLFSNENQTYNMLEFTEDYSAPFEWRSEPGAFNVNEILDSCLIDNNLGSSQEEISQTDEGQEIRVKYEDLSNEDFNDIIDFPFESVMDTFDTSGLEAASDSGVSTTDHLNDFILSPSSGTVSPDPVLDVCIDSTDTISDVSSTSDLGSMGSVGDSPNRRSEANFSNASIQFDLNSCHIDDDVEMRSLPTSINLLPERNNNHKTIVASPQYIKKVPVSIANSTSNSAQIKNIKLDLNQNPKIITPVQISNSGNSLSYKTTISNSTNSSSHNNRITATSPLNTELNISKFTQAGRSSPIVTKVRMDIGKLDTKPTSIKCNTPPTIYLTHTSKGAPLLKKHALLRTTGNGRPILVPVNVNSINPMNKMTSFKIIRSNNGTNRIGNSIGTLVSTVRPLSAVSGGTSSGTNKIATTPATIFTTTSKGSDGRPLIKVPPTACVTPNSHSIDISVTPSIIKEEPSDDESLPQSNQELILTEEERRLMRKEGLVLPSRYPLTKQEERDLKRIRRKIRNKISAQDSRKRKKEYVDGLEDRVKNCTEENKQLQKRIKTLEKQNESLKAQLKRYQTLVGNNLNHTKHHNHASTALMMLILSTALIVVPTLRQQDGKGENELSRDGKIPSSVGHSRTLLGVKNPLLNMKNLDGYPNSEQEDVDGLDYTNALTDHDYAPSAKKARLQNTMNSDYFSPPNIDKTLSFENGEPPDSGGLQGIAAMFAAMLDRLGRNWTDPGGSFDSALNLTPHHGAPERSSVVVNLNHGKLLRDDLELE